MEWRGREGHVMRSYNKEMDKGRERGGDAERWKGRL